MGAPDLELLCIDCKAPFWFSASEQRFFAVRQLAEPKRCSGCRANARARREQAGVWGR